jgi:hypothetical protein
LSEAFGSVIVTVERQDIGSVPTLIGSGHSSFGFSVSLTLTVNEHWEMLPAASFAVTSTVVVPTGKSYGKVIGVPPTE